MELAGKCKGESKVTEEIEMEMDMEINELVF